MFFTVIYYYWFYFIRINNLKRRYRCLPTMVSGYISFITILLDNLSTIHIENRSIAHSISKWNEIPTKNGQEWHIHHVTSLRQFWFWYFFELLPYNESNEWVHRIGIIFGTVPYPTPLTVHTEIVSYWWLSV